MLSYRAKIHYNFFGTNKYPHKDDYKFKAFKFANENSGL